VDDAMAERPNGRVPAFPGTFWELIAQRAARTPDQVMLIDDRGRRITSAEYARACEGFAAALHRRHGIQAGDVVSWQLPTTIEALVVKGGLARLGAVQNPVIPILRRREVEFITRQVGARLLVVPGVFRGFDHAAMASELSGEVGFDVLDLGAEPEAGPGLQLPLDDPGVLPPPPSTDAVRWLYHSSGTTADPKGIQHTDRSVMHGATGMLAVLGFGPSDVYPIVFPVAHIGGMSGLTTQLVSGAVLALMDTFDPIAGPAYMAAVGATFLGSAVPFFRAYLDAQLAHGSEPLYPHLRACVNGGAPKPPVLHAEVQSVLGGAGIISSWGLTEFPIATFGSLDDPDELIAATEGRAVPGVTVRVVGPHGRDLPAGEEGELRLHGPQLFAGYLDPALDADAFDERGFLRTGDLGVVEPTGHVRITGRIKDIIIRNAENLSALEIEDALMRHSSIHDVAVVGIPDPRTGERACAVVVLAPGAPALTLAEIGVHCRGLGLANQKIPERLEVVDALPRNLLGKVLKRDLRARYAGT
jgi:acyl-CoA synthetase (AMP-forming)/AMP-acid ligase II